MKRCVQRPGVPCAQILCVLFYFFIFVNTFRSEGSHARLGQTSGIKRQLVSSAGFYRCKNGPNLRFHRNHKSVLGAPVLFVLFPASLFYLFYFPIIGQICFIPILFRSFFVLFWAKSGIHAILIIFWCDVETRLPLKHLNWRRFVIFLWLYFCRVTKFEHLFFRLEYFDFNSSFFLKIFLFSSALCRVARLKHLAFAGNLCDIEYFCNVFLF